ncbi:minor capsid protein [Campylobacter sp. RM13119]|uniref:phage head morphogenesis protein n=1 Tax=Campylobacter californiensis TaxID=1032243 RepID=UPI0014765633|nr:phage minor head protein [Campylobacter sp. RM13119]MBE3606099.1 minor capsid protein [Campylobacter sp. RM13119]
MNFSFFDEPTAVYEYLQSKKPELHFDYDEISHDAHKRAFTIAKITEADLLKDMQDSLTKAFKEGIKFDEWKKSIEPTLIKKGWYSKTVVKSPSGEEKEIYVGSRRLKNIYNTNMRTAYAKARYEAQMDSTAEYFRYTAVLDRLTRPAHAKLHGTVLPKSDPFWDTHYPPNGWGCRCKVQALTESEVKRRGLTPLDSGDYLPRIADKDFAYNPGKVDSLESVAKERIKDYNKFKKARGLNTWQSGLNDAVDELLVKKNLKAPIVAFALGKLDKTIITKSEKILKTKIETEHIMGDKHGILHIRPGRKEKYGQDLRIDEIKQIVSVLSSDKTPVSIDINNKNIIFWFDDEKDKDKINKIVVDLNYKLKKFGLTNYMATVSKVDKANKNETNYVKIR